MHQLINWKDLKAGIVEADRSHFYLFQSSQDEYVAIAANLQRSAMFPLVLKGRKNPRMYGSQRTWRFIEGDIGLAKDEVHSTLLFGLLALTGKIKAGDEMEEVSALLSTALPFDIEFSDEGEGDLDILVNLNVPGWIVKVAKHNHLNVSRVEMKGLIDALLPSPLAVSKASGGGYGVRSESLLLSHGVDWNTMELLQKHDIGVWDWSQKRR